jgi:DNA repair protein RadD
MITPRFYQEEAIKRVSEALARGENPLVVCPTGAGKSLIAAFIMADFPGRVLLLSHVAEILVQDRQEYEALTGRNDCGYYSATLEEKNGFARVIFGGVQSVYRNSGDLIMWGDFGLVIIDEVHRVGGENTKMYRACLEAFRAPYLGLTATPYRLDSGLIYGNNGELFKRVTYQIKARDLIPEYLAPLVARGTESDIDTTGVGKQGGEFKLRELEDVAMSGNTTSRIVREAIKGFAGRKKILVFSCGVDHGNEIKETLALHGETSAAIYGKTEKETRKATVKDFAKQDLRWLININIASTGFNVPSIDGILGARSTLSKGFHVQSLGRGMRKAPGKENCLVLDFARNCLRHGDIDDLGIAYEPSEKAKRAAEELERRAGAGKRKAFETDGDLAIDPMTGVGSARITLGVKAMSYFLQKAKKYEGKQLLRVGYLTSMGWLNFWLCPEYPTAAKYFARRWYARRYPNEQMPESAPAFMARAKQISWPDEIVVENVGAKFPELITEHFRENGERYVLHKRAPITEDLPF